MVANKPRALQVAYPSLIVSTQLTSETSMACLGHQYEQLVWFSETDLA